MAKKISGSVGKGGKNKPEDTKLVQELLNAFCKKCGFKKLDEDGLIGPKTNSAISSFQKSAVGMSRPDGRVDPGGKSFSTLAMGPKKAETEAKKAEKTEAKKEAKEKKAEEKKNKKQEEAEEKKNKKQEEAKEKRNGKQQAVNVDGDELWQGWLKSHDRGRKIPVLNKGNNKKLRVELDDHYNHADKKKFLATVAKNSKKLKG